ncbi:MAG: hypothetical protein WKF81_00185 [Thermomicrobiales bacterium]
MHHTWRLLRWILIISALLVSSVPGGFLASRRLIPPFATLQQGTASPPVPEPISAPDDPLPDLPWIVGDGSPIAPVDFPIKANQRSGIFHLPGDLAYGRTVAARHYRSAEAAEADRYRHARR